jgi:hypothetical protein
MLMSSISVAAAIALALLLATRLGRVRGVSIALLLAGIGAAVAGAIWLDPRTPGAGPVAQNRPIEVEGDGYVSPGTCKACHAREYATWSASYHRTMTQVAGPESVIAPFDQRIEFFGRRYQLERRGDTFRVDIDLPVPRARDGSLPRWQAPVVMTTGSHHMQLYWYATEHARLVALLPLAYLVEDQRWVPRDSIFLAPPTRDPNVGPRWNSTCIRCHSTHGQQREIRPGEYDTHVASLGISCQACHGPAEEHVRVNREPYRRYRQHLNGGADATVVQPRRLTAQLSSQVCGQCHGVYYFRNGDDMRAWNLEGYRYRPGRDLNALQLVVRHTPALDGAEMPGILEAYPQYDKADHFWSDGMIRVSGREFNGLVESPCAASPDFSCMSCHTMHKAADDPRPLKEWADDQLAQRMDGDEACLQCHSAFRADPTRHTFHKAESSGSRCYNCHMPYTTYGLLKALRSHQVNSPTVTASLATGRPNACNQCHLNQTLAWTADQLERWYGIPKPEMNEDQRRIAASILWGLSGDAGQRALIAWSMGWDAAREASGTDWVVPYLAQLIRDPYDAVRTIARRSLRRVAGYEGVADDAFGDPSLNADAARAVLTQWEADHDRRHGDERLLIDPRGTLERDEFIRLLQQRDDRPIVLKE